MEAFGILAIVLIITIPVVVSATIIGVAIHRRKDIRAALTRK